VIIIVVGTTWRRTWVHIAIYYFSYLICRWRNKCAINEMCLFCYVQQLSSLWDDYQTKVNEELHNHISSYATHFPEVKVSRYVCAISYYMCLIWLVGWLLTVGALLPFELKVWYKILLSCFKSKSFVVFLFNWLYKYLEIMLYIYRTGNCYYCNLHMHTLSFQCKNGNAYLGCVKSSSFKTKTSSETALLLLCIAL